MTKTIKFILTLLLILSSLLPLWIVSADTGPKPTMDFNFTQGFAGPSITITSGILLECETADCQDAKPLLQAGPQRFSCDSTSCHALAYGFSTFNRLEIQFSDGKMRQSNVFKTAQFQSSYKVTIRQTDLLVVPIFNLNLFSPLTYVLLCGCCLIVVLIIIVAVILLVRRTARKK